MDSAAVVQVLRSSCMKLLRLPICKSLTTAQSHLAYGLHMAGMDQEVSALNYHIPHERPALGPPLLASTAAPQEAADDASTYSSHSLPQPPTTQYESSQHVPPGADQPPDAKRPRLVSAHYLPLSTPLTGGTTLYAPWNWNEMSAEQKADWLLVTLVGLPMPPPPYRDPWVARRQLQQQINPDEMLENLIGEVLGGPASMDLSFLKVSGYYDDELE